MSVRRSFRATAKLVAKFRTPQALLAVTAITLAGIVLVLGLLLDIERFSRVADMWPATVLETACAILTSGLALLFLSRGECYRTTASVALSLTSLGFVALGTYATWRTGVDASDGMAPSSSITLGAIAIGILFRCIQAFWAHVAAIGLSVVGSLITSFALLGYLFDAPALAALAGFKQMGLSTAAGGYLLSLSLMFANQDNVVLRGLLGSRVESRIIRAYAVISSLLVLAVCKYMMTLVASGWLSPSVRMTILVTLLLATILGGSLAMGYFVERLEVKKQRLRAVEKVLSDTDHAKQLADARSENLQVLGQVVAGVAHDFNNAMTALRGNLELIQADPANSADYANEALAAANRASEMARQLVKSGKRNGEKPSPQALALLVEQVLGMFRRVAPANIALEFEGPEVPVEPVEIDPTSFERALLNLLINAQHAIGSGREGGRIDVRVRQREFDETGHDRGRWGSKVQPGTYTVVEVRDNGCGMDAETLANAGKPYFTTKGEDAGSGLGLASAIGMCEQVGGALVVESEPGIGTKIVMALPSVGISQFDSNDTVSNRLEHHILLVCGDNAVATKLIHQIEAVGNVVEWHRDPKTALAAAQRGILPHAVLIEPEGLEGVSGREVAARFRQDWPRLNVTLIGESRTDRQLARLQQAANSVTRPQLAYGRSLGEQ